MLCCVVVLQWSVWDAHQVSSQGQWLLCRSWRREGTTLTRLVNEHGSSADVTAAASDVCVSLPTATADTVLPATARARSVDCRLHYITVKFNPLSRPLLSLTLLTYVLTLWVAHCCHWLCLLTSVVDDIVLQSASLVPWTRLLLAPVLKVLQVNQQSISSVV